MSVSITIKIEELSNSQPLHVVSDQSLLDTFKTETLCDPSHNIPLPPLDGLVCALALLNDFNSTSVRYQDLFSILNTRRNTSHLVLI